MKGIIVNHQKTEMFYFFSGNNPDIILKVGNNNIKPQNTIKALGITTDRKLKWTCHISNSIKKVNTLTSGLRIVTKHLNKEQSLRIITLQIFLVLYYPAPIWLTTELSCRNLRRLESVHYSTLRLGIKDLKKSPE